MGSYDPFFGVKMPATQIRTNISWSYQPRKMGVVSTTKQVLFQLQPKGITLTTMVVIELHFVVVLTLKSGVILNQDGVILTHDVVILTIALLLQPKFELHLC